MKQYFDPKESPFAKKRRIATGIIICLAYIVFCLWAGFGWLVLLPLIADYYFTKYINWGWGRDHSNPVLRSIISLVGDVVYVVIAVSFLYTFFFQNFGIPSSSLEKTLLTGDYLFVSKLKYGPRMPMTPIGLPLVANRLGDTETYLTTPTLDYKRLAGYGEIERYDLVVFNFPAGDTVATKMTNPDYLSLCAIYGREAVHSDKAQFGDIIYRPIDRRDHYVKRLIGMPGDNLQIINRQVYANGKALTNPEKMQYNYLVQTDGSDLGTELLDALEINYRDVLITPDLVAPTEERVNFYKQRYGISPLDSMGNFGKLYEIPLTQAMIASLKGEPSIRAIEPVSFSPEESSCYPAGYDYGWTIDNYGPIWIPKAGASIKLTSDNYPIYERVIRAYEGRKIERQADGTILIDGKATNEYTFGQNYYWMMGDNRHNSADSRAWGFVPEDHIVGTPSFLWLSLNDEQALFSGGIRWSRMMRFIKSH